MTTARTLIALCALVFFANPIQAQHNDDAVAAIMELLRSEDPEMRKLASRRIYEFGGFTDAALFDLIAERLEHWALVQKRRSTHELDEYEWYAKALVSSGDKRYLSVLERIQSEGISSRKRTYAEAVLEWADYFQEWNAVMSSIPYSSSNSDPRRVAAYKQLLASENLEIRVAVCRRIYDYSGITDKGLYQLIVGNINRIMQKESHDDKDIEELSWQVKALSASGLEEYRPLFEDVLQIQLSDDRQRKLHGPGAPANDNQRKEKLHRHVATANKNLKIFARWNAVLAHSEHEKTGRQARVADWMDLMRFGDTRMKTYAVRQVYGYDIYDEDFKRMASDYLEEHYGFSSNDRDELDLQAWICRLLGKYPSESSKQLLQEVKDNTPNRKVQRYANIGLREMEK